MKPICHDGGRRNRNCIRNGLSLLELVVVLVILVALAVLVIPLVSRNAEDSRDVVTQTSIRRLHEVIMNRYLPDMGKFPAPKPNDGDTSEPHPQITYLFINPENGTTTPTFNAISRRGWNGPYLMSTGAVYKTSDDPTTKTIGFDATYGTPGDPAILDTWGSPIILKRETINQEVHVSILSAGSDRALGTPDDLILYLTKNAEQNMFSE